MRVTVHQIDPEKATLKIEGKISGPRVAELNRAWRELATALGDKQLSVDLRGVTFLDEQASRLLAEIYAKAHAEFIADTPLSKYFAQQAQQNVRSNNRSNVESNSEPKVRRQL